MAGRSGCKLPVLAVTGGIGSGKSSISRMLETMDVPAYVSDERTKRLYDTDPLLRDALVRLLGPSVLRNDRIDRREMARIVFSDPDRLAAVEDAVYPRVLEDFRDWTDRQAAPFVVFESALLLEKPLFRSLGDRVLTVSADRELRVERVIRRDGLDRGQVLARMACQWEDGARESLADYVIRTDGNRAVLPQVLAVYRAMLEVERNLKPAIR